MRSFKFHTMPEHHSYEICQNGIIRSAVTHEEIPFYRTGSVPQVVLDGVTYSVPVLFANTFIGPIDLPVMWPERDLNAWSVTYTFRELHYLDAVTAIIDGHVFKRVPQVDQYYISEAGVIWEARRHKFARVSYDKNGYVISTLINSSGDRDRYKVHRLVYASWVKSPIPADLVVDHIDDVKYHNHYTNLQLLTEAANKEKGRVLRTETENGVILSVEQLHTLCKMIEKNESLPEICRVLGYDLAVKGTAMRNLIHRIIKKDVFSSISCYYDFSKRLASMQKSNIGNGSTTIESSTQGVA